MKLEKLTKQQTEKLSEYRDKWLAIGLDIKRANRSVAEIAMKEAYKIAGLAEPKIFIWVDSPIGGLMAAKLVKEIAKKYKTYSAEGARQVWAQVRDQVGDQVWAQVRDQVWDQVRDQVGDQVWDQVGDQVRDQVGDQVWDQVRAQVGDQVWAQVRDQVRDQVVKTSLRNEWNDLNFWGLHDANWLGFYDYFLKACGLECCKKLQPLMTLAQEVGWTWLYTDVVIFSEKPIEVHRNSQNRLHKDGSAALSYADGYSLYSLNGIRVDEATAKLKPSEVTKEIILNQKNADIRREIVRKVGIEKAVEILGAEVVDTYESPVGGKYELLLIDYDLQRGKRPFLRMKNPSMDNVSHIEGVRPGTKTVKEALCYRNGLEEFKEPIFLT